MKRARAQGLTAATVALGALTSRVATAQTFGYDDRSRYESPQNFLLELRGGNFVPNVDAALGAGRTPYFDIFSAPRSTDPVHPDATRVMPWRPLISAEFDWQIVRIGPVLSLGVGLSAGYFNASANAPLKASVDANPTNPSQWVLSAQSTSLGVAPISLLAVARFDGLARHVPYLPLVPYVKFGPAYSFWWTTSGMSSTSDALSNLGASGGSLGFYVAGGLSVMLDVFEPGLARRWDSTQGVNHSYVFFELYATPMLPRSLLGNPQLDVGTPLGWDAGIAIEF